MGLNINTSDSDQLNQPEPEKKKKQRIDNAVGANQYGPMNGYVVIEKGKKIRKWLDTEGKMHEDVV